MTNFATDQINTHFCCHYSQAECSTSNNCHIWLLPLGQNSCKQQLLVCLSFTSCHIWLLHLGQNSCKQQLLACLSPLAIFGYYILVSCWQASAVGFFFTYFFSIFAIIGYTQLQATNWLCLYSFISAIVGYILASPPPSAGFASILSSLPHLVTS